MSQSEPVSYRAPLAAYALEADELLAALHGGSDDAAWCFKWMHPHFRGAPVAAVRDVALEMGDAQLVVAREYAFESWTDLAAFVDDVARGGSVAEFENAVEAVVDGDVATLRGMLRANPALARARSMRRHHATLLHYVAANGVENVRQRTPANAVEVASVLLDAGAEPDALADMYDARCTTMSMLVSSDHPARAGLQIALATTLLDHGASLHGKGTAWQSAVTTALTFGFADTARALAERDRPDDLPIAAGLGWVDDVIRLLPSADIATRHRALALAAQHGQLEAVRLLLDAGEDPDRYNPEGHHAHSTPLHQAVWADHLEVVRLLVERGARMDIGDTLYNATALGWADHGGRTAIAEYLRDSGAPSTVHS